VTWRASRREAPVTAAFPSPRERAVVAWAEAVAAGPGPVADAPRAALREHFGDHEVVELTLLAGATLMLNRFCTALELPTPPDVVARLVEEGWA